MRRVWISGVLVGVLGAGISGAAADTVVRNDGAKFSGVVTKTDDGYSVKMKAGSITIPAEDVDHIIKESVPAPAPAPAATGSGSLNTGIVTPPRIPAPAIATGKPGAKVVDAKTLQALLAQGQAALAAGEYKAAADAFKDVLTLDPRNAIALHGSGAAYMYMHDFPHATAPMEKALTASPSPDRALVLNMAVMQIAVRNPIGGAKIIKDYLTTHSKVMDEPMLNAMAIALNDADDQARKLRLFADCAQFYATYNARLEALVPGQKRWGIEWLPAAEVEAKQADAIIKQKEADKLAPQLDQAIAAIEPMQRELDREASLVSRGFYTDLDVTMMKQNVQEAIANRDRLSDAYDAAMAAITHPHFPAALSLVALDDLTPPPVRAVSVAMVSDPTEAPPAPRVAKPKPSQKRRKPANTGGTSTGSGMANAAPPPPAIDVVQSKPAERRKVQITSYAAAFPVSSNLVVTSAAAIQGASSIDLQTSDGSTLKGEVVRTDESSGLALLRVSGSGMRALEIGAAFPGGSVQCAGYPNVNIFNPAGELMTGFGAAPKEGWKVRLEAHPRLPGGPLLSGGKVVGVELATRESDTASIPAATLDQLRTFLGSDLTPQPPTRTNPAEVLLQVLATRESR